MKNLTEMDLIALTYNETIRLGGGRLGALRKGWKYFKKFAEYTGLADATEDFANGFRDGWNA
ncbi:hypothetical protein [Fodinibius sediminis]|uniref:Uncharacterized protein n=1 Tax=Fodinibius sediminis TaxID=1214077 RepID=A0A521B2Y7_9BACT|nr:hypothetical protein [Fodinibius sediminis]SMO41381.1 hypothetical protein SAMN06265218_102137 [Fodinibius sediminis]